MKITKKNRPQDSITIGLVQPTRLTAAGWIKAPEYEVVNPPTTMVRMPYGPFAVRVITTADTLVLVHIDGKPMLVTRVAPGINVLDRDSWGRTFRFAAQEDVQDGFAASEASLFSEAPDLFAKPLEFELGLLPESLLADLKEEDAGPVAKTHGLVMITACFAGPPNGDGGAASGPPDYWVRGFMQMNEPQTHARELAANLHRLVAPPSPPDNPELCDHHHEPKSAGSVNQAVREKRFCAVCRRCH